MAASEIAFLSLTDEPLFEMTIPAKLQSYLACGIPTVASASGETARIIKDSNSGLSEAPGDEKELTFNIVSLINKFSFEIDELGKMQEHTMKLILIKKNNK